jgi:hypothetical protein
VGLENEEPTFPGIVTDPVAPEDEPTDKAKGNDEKPKEDRKQSSPSKKQKG